jgi:hypothetical protein
MAECITRFLIEQHAHLVMTYIFGNFPNPGIPTPGASSGQVLLYQIKYLLLIT